MAFEIVSVGVLISVKEIAVPTCNPSIFPDSENFFWERANKGLKRTKAKILFIE
jgi:hypothetical protein